jgi:hypothetical protein
MVIAMNEWLLETKPDNIQVTYISLQNQHSMIIEALMRASVQHIRIGTIVEHLK